VGAVTLVAGPPGAGNSTWVAGQRRPGDLVYDYDALMAAVTGLGWWERTPAGHHAVTVLRDVLGELAPRTASSWWWITSAPGRDERAAWRDAGADVVVVLAPLEVSIARCASRPVSQDWPEAIGRWWSRYEPDPADRVVHTVEGVHV
jgi:hypothetical protein